MKLNLYAGTEKQKLGRIAIWSRLADNVRPDGKILIMPEKNRLELDVLKSYGIAVARILAVDKNPANIATFTKKLSKEERRGIERKGTVLSTACTSWFAKGYKLAAAHFDFCGNVDGYSYGSPRAELELVARTCIIDNSYIAITVLKGRETKASTKLFTRKQLLMNAVAHGLGKRAAPSFIAEGEYFNNEGSSPMYWIILQILGSTR